MSFQARYFGRCPGCDEPIHPGQDVEYNEDHMLLHVGCQERDEGALLRTEVSCPQCFLIHAGECA